MVAGLVGSVPVVVVFVGLEDVSCVGLSRDEDVVEEFASDGADDPFAVGVHPRCPWCAFDDAEVVGLEDGVERLAVLAVAVAEQERRDSVRVLRSEARFLACWVVHACVGWAVTPVMCRRLVPCSRNASA